MNTALRIVRIVLPVAAVILLVTQVVVSTQLATLSSHMGKLDTAVALQQDVHEILETEVASASALLTLRDRAEALGFHEPTSKQIVALSPQVPGAFGVTDTQARQPLLP